MARTNYQVPGTLQVKRRAKIERRVNVMTPPQDLRPAIERTQQELAVRLCVGRDAISRMERQTDLLLSTLRHQVEAMGGQLLLLAKFS